MYERFSNRAKKVINLAHKESQQSNHEHISTEDILLGLTSEGSGVAAVTLKNFNLTFRRIRMEIKKHKQAVPRASDEKKVIENAMEEARLLKHNYVGTEHLLLGLLREEDCLTVKVLRDLRLSIEEIRNEVLNLLDLRNVYERFTNQAKKVMNLAYHESQLFGHEHIGTDDILLGLISEGSGLAAVILNNCNLTFRRIRMEIKKHKQVVPQASEVKKVVENAMEEVRTLKYNYLGTEHLLLGLLREEDCLAVTVLQDLGLSIEEIRNEVLNFLGHGL
ncbi:Clp protease N-terminal domain-containing protein [Gimesia aquarii]|uniref:Negative regulator of genetic competence ClpC/MecB n=1 Tax=Gimesia aquarii TaxID=2527964 RepID=A0A517W1Y3_9PLAN|nr:Clp protease N-terminal domain-containing protein [Gimesia aquarii]QDT99251.1 Negative regulator of genetic competence ClpC/MecB [Gimesia aquarii]